LEYKSALFARIKQLHVRLQAKVVRDERLPVLGAATCAPNALRLQPGASSMEIARFSGRTSTGSPRILVAETGAPTMLAQISVKQTLNRCRNTRDRRNFGTWLYATP
jgi:hypothetical protein